MTDEKLLKKAKKLAKWARKHGYEHVDVFALGPDKIDPRWFAHISVNTIDGNKCSVSDFYEDGELDE